MVNGTVKAQRLIRFGYGIFTEIFIQITESVRYLMEWIHDFPHIVRI